MQAVELTLATATSHDKLCFASRHGDDEIRDLVARTRLTISWPARRLGWTPRSVTARHHAGRMSSISVVAIASVLLRYLILLSLDEVIS
jgi:hypothetical protein